MSSLQLSLISNGPCGSLQLTVGVENTRDTDVDTVLAVEAVRQRLCYALALVVACTRADGVNMPPTNERV